VTIEGIDGNTYMTPYNPEREYGRGSVYECMDVDGRSVHSWNEMVCVYMLVCVCF